MKIVNSEIILPIVQTPSTEYFETALKEREIDFIRWAIVHVEKENYVLNVSHKVCD